MFVYFTFVFILIICPDIEQVKRVNVRVTQLRVQVVAFVFRRGNSYLKSLDLDLGK